MEYMGCTALASEEQWEIRTMPLIGTKWRHMDPITLVLSDSEPISLQTESELHVLHVGVWCDTAPVDSVSKERCPHGATILGSQERTDAIGDLLPDATRLELEKLSPGEDMWISGLNIKETNEPLTKNQRRILCEAIEKELENCLKCSLEGGDVAKMRV